MTTITRIRSGVLPRAASPASLGRILRIAGVRVGVELRSYFRRSDQVFFTFLFPVGMLAIFSSIFGELGGEGGIAAADYYLPAMLASGILLSGFQNLGVDLALARTDGTMKRYAGTPMPPTSFFLGKLGQAFVTGAAQAGILIVVANKVFGVELPDDAESWFTIAWVFLLGTATSALLGIAISRVPRSGASASAVIVPIALVLQFVSGVYIQFAGLPEWMQQAAMLFPVAWMALGMRAAFLPDDLARLEIGESWNLEGVALALGLWFVIGLIAVRLTFRWIRRT